MRLLVFMCGIGASLQFLPGLGTMKAPAGDCAPVEKSRLTLKDENLNEAHPVRWIAARSLSAANFVLRSSTSNDDESDQEVPPFAVPGKTSALKNATDYELNVAVTEAEYLYSSSSVPAPGKLSDAEVYKLQTLGVEAVGGFHWSDAIDSLSKVVQERPDRYVFHYPLALFYMEVRKRSKGMFSQSIAREFYRMGHKCARFYTAGSDEYIFGDAVNIVLTRRGDVDCGISPWLEDKKEVKESRQVFRLARTMFRTALISLQRSAKNGEGESESVGEDLDYVNPRAQMIRARAELSELAMSLNNKAHKAKGTDSLTSVLVYFYLGLFEFARGDEDAAKDYIRMCVKKGRERGGGGLEGECGMMFAVSTGWFDDYCEEGEGDETANVDRSYFEIVDDEIGKMTSKEMTHCCKCCGVRGKGKKEDMAKELKNWFSRNKVKS